MTGLDSSPEMIEAARRDVPGIEFEVADLRDWVSTARPRRRRRAGLQRHAPVGAGPPRPAPVARRDRSRPAAGSRSRCPATSTSRATPSAPTWPPSRRTPRTPPASRCRSSHDPADYYDVLADAGCTVDAWETTYLHVLSGPDPVFTWVSGTGARPTLQALPADLRAEVRGRVQGAGWPRRTPPAPTAPC